MNTQDDGFNDIFGPIPKSVPTPESKSFMDEIASYAKTKVPAGSLASFGAGPDAQAVPGFEYQPKETAGSYATEALSHPGEVLKGVVKGVPGAAASVTKAFDTGLTGAANLIPGVDIGHEGGTFGGKTMLDYKPVEELTAPSNKAQEVGYVAGSLLPVEKGIQASKPLVEEGVKIATPYIEKAIEKGTPLVERAGDTLAEMASKAEAPATKVVGKTSEVVGKLNPLGTKTPEQILATPEDAKAISKLTDAQREYYFSEKSKGVTEATQAHVDALKKEADALTARNAAEMAQKTEDASKAIDEASKNLDVAGYNEVQSLQPKLKEVIKKNGDTYTELIDKAMPEEVRSQMVTKNELASQINAKVNSADPASIADAQQKIAFINKYLPDTGSTVGDLYDAMKAIRKENIAKSTMKGTRATSADEFQALDAISEITDLLRSRGVDLSEANSFWAKNAEARDKLIKALSPYAKTTGFENLGALKSFRKNITDRIAGNLAPEESSFLSAAEDYMGVKFGNPETVAAYNKLTEAEKTKVALKAEQSAKEAIINIAKENGIDAAKMSAKEALDAINQLKVTTAQKVANKRKIQVALAGAAALMGVPTLGYNFFFKD